MDERATGIILRTRPLTETSLIVNWLTAGAGRISTVAKGARRPKSVFRGKLDLYFYCDFSFGRSRSSTLHALREVVTRDTHSVLRENLAWLEQAAYCGALIEQCTEAEAPIPDIFEMFAGLLDHLPRQKAQPRTVFAFELKLLQLLGQLPDFEEARLGDTATALCEEMVRRDWKELPALKSDAATVKKVRQFLHGFLIYHLGKIPKGRAEALA